MPTFESQTLAERLGGQLQGENREVSSLVSLERARADAVVVLSKAAEVENLSTAEVAVLVVPADLTLETPHPVIRVADTRLALAQLTQMFGTRADVAEGQHSSATIHPEAALAEDVHLATNVTVAAGARLGRGTRVGSGCVIGQNVVVGEDCILHANVTLYEGVRLGDRVQLHSGVVIGADGFGYAAGARGAVKIHHLGGVVLENDVEIGANSCVDRGTLDDTRIGARTKIDNLCQIGHNVSVGSDCLLAGGVAVGGSTRIGNRVTVGGLAGFADHLEIGDDVRIAGRAGVTKDIPAGETWAGFPAQPYKKWVRGLYLVGKLETLWQAFKKRRDD